MVVDIKSSTCCLQIVCRCWVYKRMLGLPENVVYKRMLGLQKNVNTIDGLFTSLGTYSQWNRMRLWL